MPLKFSISWYMEIEGTILITRVWLEFFFFFFHFCAYYWFFSLDIQKYFYYLPLPEGLIREPLIGVSTLWMDGDLVIIFSYAFQGRKICWKLDVYLFSIFFLFILIFHIL